MATASPVERVEDDLVLVRTYLTNTSKQRMARIGVGVNLVRAIQPMGELEVKRLDDADWESAWKSHFTLLKIGNKLVIKPSWIDYRAEQDEVVIELDPGMAFGTGYHPTTRMCLEALEELVQPGMDVLDLGTGSGILAIAAARTGRCFHSDSGRRPCRSHGGQKEFQGQRTWEGCPACKGNLAPPFGARWTLRPGNGQYQRKGNLRRGLPICGVPSSPAGCLSHPGLSGTNRMKSKER